MTKPTTEELKDLLGKVTQGEWHFGKDCEAGLGSGFFIAGGGSVLADMHSSNQINDATLIALAPTLAAEVVRLREALAGALDTMLFAQAEIKEQAHIPHEDEEVMNDRIERARQALSQK